MKLDVQRIDWDLAQIREDVEPFFVEYDAAVHELNRQRAHAAKLAVTRSALRSLRECVGATARGLYLVVGADEQLHSLKYIGMTTPGTFLDRFEHRLRDETCLDASQYHRSREDIWDRAYQRMCVSMVSKPDKLIEYAFKHVKTTHLFREAERIVFLATDGSKEAVKSAESLLIYSGVSAGAPLLNIQERDNLVTDFRPGKDLALRAISEASLDNGHWLDRANTLLSKFRGHCC